MREIFFMESDLGKCWDARLSANRLKFASYLMNTNFLQYIMDGGRKLFRSVRRAFNLRIRVPEAETASSGPRLHHQRQRAPARLLLRPHCGDELEPRGNLHSLASARTLSQTFGIGWPRCQPSRLAQWIRSTNEGERDMADIKIHICVTNRWEQSWISQNNDCCQQYFWITFTKLLCHVSHEINSFFTH